MGKKKILKKWWFWVVLVILFLGIVGVLGDDSTSNYSKNEEELSLTTNAPSNLTTIQNESTTEDFVNANERTYEVVRKFVELYNNKLDPDIINTEEFLTEDRILQYDEAYAINGEVDGKYICLMNFGPWEVKDKLRIEIYVDTPEEVFDIISNVSKVIEKPLTEEECNKTKQYLNECFTDEYQKYTEWTSVNSIMYWSGYNGIGDNYEVIIEFSIDKFYK